MILAVDTGGTFTDLVVEDNGRTRLFKAPTTPADPTQGLLDVIAVAAHDDGRSPAEMLGASELLVYGTTRALNAILTRATATTAFLTTAGHPDTLVIREGGRRHPFDFRRPHPAPYVPRSLTYEINERIGFDGQIVSPLDEEAARSTIRELQERNVEAVAVCLLWSVVNPSHERRLGELLRDEAPQLAVTLSHELNPCLREYRRAISASIDASLKPVMSEYLTDLEARLRAAGYSGRVLMVTSSGGMLDVREVARAPIHAINSGPAMAPVAGAHFAAEIAEGPTVIVADAGGTSYDVSVVRRGRISWTREMWLGEPHMSDMTGFPAVDVRSVGAGGGSIAGVDPAGLLHVGPQSAGANPGPACYGRGNTEPTVTDACLALGYLDPAYFLGGSLTLSEAAAEEAIRMRVGEPLGLAVDEAAHAILRVATERMVSAIEDVTVQQGVDPRQAVLVAGGGAAGLNSDRIARRLGCRTVLFPQVGATLSAAGAARSKLGRDFVRTHFSSSADFDSERTKALLAELTREADDFVGRAGRQAVHVDRQFSVEARYPDQIWEIELSFEPEALASQGDASQLTADFHKLHTELFATSDPESEVDFITWRLRVECTLLTEVESEPERREPLSPVSRRAFFGGRGWVATPRVDLGSIQPGDAIEGPALIASALTTIVVEPASRVKTTGGGSLLLEPVAPAEHEAAPGVTSVGR